MIKKMLDLVLVVFLVGIVALAIDIYTNGAISGAFAFRGNAIAEEPVGNGNNGNESNVSEVPVAVNLTPPVPIPSPAPQPPAEEGNVSGGNATSGEGNRSGGISGGSSPPSPQPPVFPEVPNGTHFSLGGKPTDRWMDVYGNLTIGGQPAEIGDEVAAFDPDGVLCGLFRVRFAGIYGFLHIYGDDGSTPEDEGAKAGDVLTFEVYDKSGNKELDAVPSINASWAEKGMVAADLRA